MEDNNKCSIFPFSWGIFMKKSINLVKSIQILDYKLIFIRKQQDNLER